ncbi:MAG: hypothetical protein AB9907_16130 [Flexilinea sp.]
MNRKAIITIGLLIGGTALSVLPACTPVAQSGFKTVVAGIIETVQIMESRTPYPTASYFPTQISYPSQSPYPTEDGYDPSLDEIIANMFTTATPYPSQTLYPTEEPALEEDTRQIILIQPGLWSRNLSQYGRCGDWFEVKIGTHLPYFSYAVGYEVSKKAVFNCKY